MKKVIRLTEKDLTRLVNKVISEQIFDTKLLPKVNITPKPSKFLAYINVEGDMVMERPVVQFRKKNNKLEIQIYDQYRKQLLTIYEKNGLFMGPAYDSKTGEQVFDDTTVTNCDIKSYQQIAKQYNIPIITI